jgi:type VI secretion system secreted protein Hcp
VDNTSSLTSGGGTTTSRSLPKAFTFTADVSRASPELFAHCANGSHIKEGTLTLRANRRGAQQAAFYTIKLTDIIVSSFNQAGSAGGDAPMDEFSLTFARVQVAYTQQSESGSPTTPVASGWDFRQNLKF